MKNLLSNMKEIIDFKELKDPLGTHFEVFFENGYGMSLIRTETSYGGRDGLWEIALIGLNNKITFPNILSNDSIGWLTEDDVVKYIIHISKY